MSNEIFKYAFEQKAKNFDRLKSAAESAVDMGDRLNKKIVGEGEMSHADLRIWLDDITSYLSQTLEEVE